MEKGQNVRIKLQRADVGDIEAVAPLFDQYRSFYGQSPDLAGAISYLRARTERGESVIFCAWEQGEQRTVGFVQLYPSFSSVSMRGSWILNDLYVEPAFRRCGVARELMEAARQFAEQEGSKGLALATSKTNTNAQRLYESLGYVRDEAFWHYNYTINRN